MADRSIKLVIRAEVDGAKKALQDTAKAAQQVGDSAGKAAQASSSAAGKMMQSARDNAQAWTTAGTSLTAFGAVGAVALGGAAKAAIDWESAWAGVTKTVDGTATQMAELEEGLRGMAGELPAAHSEIAAVAEAAGQLGIQTPNILDFTRVMIDLGEATNLSADEAATALARFANIMGTSQSEFSNIGSAVVDLGNNFATTEREIVEMGLRLAGAGRQAGLTEGEVLGLATALSSVGIEAQAGGTAFSRVIIEMAKSVDTQGEKLQTFADVAGMTAAQFSAAWRDDAGSAIAAFVAGLGDMEASGQSIQPILEDLGMTDIRVGDALRRASGAAEIFTGAMDKGNEAYAENVALTTEAAQRYATVESQIKMAKNAIVDAGISLGSVFLPAIADVAGGIADVSGALAKTPDSVLQVAGAFAGVTSAAALLGGGLLLVVPRIADTIDAFKRLREANAGMAGALGRIGKAAGIAAAGFVALQAAGAALNEFELAASKTDKTTSELENTLLGLGGSGDLIGDLFGDLAGKIDWVDWDRPTDALRYLADPSLTEGVAELSAKLVGLSHEGKAARERMAEIGQALSTMDASAASEAFNSLNEAFGGTGESAGLLLSLMPAYREQLAGVATSMGMAADDATLLALATGQIDPAMNSAARAMVAVNNGAAALKSAFYDAGEAQTGFVSSMDAAAAAGEEAAEAYAKWRDATAESAASFINLSDALTAGQEAAAAYAEETGAAADSAAASWASYAENGGVSLDAFLTKLEEQQAAQQEWQTNMILLSASLSATAKQMLLDLGPAGAQVAADLVAGGEEAVARFNAAVATGGTNSGMVFANNVADSAEVIMAARAAGLGDKLVAEIAAKLGSGQMTVQQVIDAYDLSAEVELFANTVPYWAELGVTLGTTEESSATSTIEGDNDPYLQKLGTALKTATSSSATSKIHGDDDPYVGVVSAAVAWAASQSATATLNADASNAYAVLRGFLNSIPSSVSVALKAVPVVGGVASALLSGGFAGGGFTGYGGKYEPAGIVHRSEFVHTTENVAKPGMLGFHQDLWATNDLDAAYARYKMRGYAGGGWVGHDMARSYAAAPSSSAPAAPSVSVPREMTLVVDGRPMRAYIAEGVEASMVDMVRSAR